MKRLRTVLLIGACALIAAPGSPARADSVSGLVAEGNRLYGERRFKEALEKYRQAQALDPASPGVHYNIGNVLYQAGQFDKAYEEYRQAFAAREKALAEGARFNAGNTHLARKNWEEAIRNYQEALRLQPEDVDAKRNLELALRQMQEQNKKRPPPPRPGAQQGEPPPDQKPPPDDQQKDKDQQDPNGRKGQDGESDRSNPNGPQRDRKQQSPAPREKLSREEALRLLDAMKNQEKGKQMPILTQPPERKPERDW
ncbi:MAG TPA: tetratricopeptide repeat protein [Candidatus Polarisedimenticolia bacterium]|jgi:tetratricopeptide (TPR) repeat protein